MKTIYTRFLLAALVLVMPSVLTAQHFNRDSTWTYGGNFGVSMNQAALINWTAGGENSLGLNLNFDYYANYKSERDLWNNRIDLEYGINDMETTGTRKTADKIYFSTTYGREIGTNWYLSAFATFDTQFADGFKYTTKDGVELEQQISSFMAPAYLTAGLGLTWTPKKWFLMTLSPAAYRGVFVSDSDLATNYGLDAGESYRTEFGANADFEVKCPVMKNVDLYSRLSLYSNYLEDAQNVDVNWKVKLNMTINKWLSANLGTTLIYDDNVMIANSKGVKAARIQFQELLGVGLNIRM